MMTMNEQKSKLKQKRNLNLLCNGFEVKQKIKSKE